MTDITDAVGGRGLAPVVGHRRFAVVASREMCTGEFWGGAVDRVAGGPDPYRFGPVHFEEAERAGVGAQTMTSS
ncbi:hypothetical protein KV100_03085 [Mumia sp. zg.B21]|uniref:hypothetical protein n=1 Tax=Mumia sp. zg.B21 TaxID=2855447 RepID=UPI001C6F1B56|nr:hypothetical protein [Mumia sp. zg.B21]MBW9208625.1 hypothetical protein [Mumia sp. zg.B21]